MIDTLQFCKVRNVKSPARAHEFDAGIDFFVPEDLTNEQMKSKFEVTHDIVETIVKEGVITDFILQPGQNILIPSGIHVNVPQNYALIYFNKSGVATKKHLVVGASVVDYGYQGECHINLINTGNTPQIISAGDKIVQGILMPISVAQTEEVGSIDLLYKEISSRGAGGFGSSGTK